MATADNTQSERKCCRSPKETYSAEGKIAIVTGGNAGIGYETAKHLNLAGAKVYLFCRNKERAEKAIQQMVEEGCEKSRLIFVQCDFASFASVRESAKTMLELENTIDILVNNAGIMFLPKFEKTVDGHEMTWQCNYLGPFLLTSLLLPALKNSRSARIVNLSSALHKTGGPMDFSKVDDESNYGKLAAYSRTKLASVMHAVELSSRLRKEGVTNVTVNSVDPGAVHTNILHNSWVQYLAWPIMKLFYKSPYDGAKTSLYCAMSEKVEGVTGKYFADSKIASEKPHALDEKGSTIFTLSDLFYCFANWQLGILLYKTF